MHIRLTGYLPREWKSAMTQFAIIFPERFVQQL